MRTIRFAVFAALMGLAGACAKTTSPTVETTATPAASVMPHESTMPHESVMPSKTAGPAMHEKMGTEPPAMHETTKP